ncbi:MAG: hypothetical protein WBP11_15875 [Dokdonella sp.]
MSASFQTRHDVADLRRLEELGIAALDWRHPPARPSRMVIIDSDEPANTTLKDIMKGLCIAGISAHLRGKDATAAPSADAIVIRFGAADITALPDQGTANVLPTLADLRSNASAKRQAWSLLRAMLWR